MIVQTRRYTDESDGQEKFYIKGITFCCEVMAERVTTGEIDHGTVDAGLGKNRVAFGDQAYGRAGLDEWIVCPYCGEIITIIVVKPASKEETQGPQEIPAE